MSEESKGAVHFSCTGKSKFAWLRPYLQLYHSASHAYNHNALRHLTSFWDILHKIHAQKKPIIRDFIVSGNVFFRNLPKILGEMQSHHYSVDYLCTGVPVQRCVVTNESYSPSTSGGLGVVWFLPWVFFIHESPSDHPRVSPEEKNFIEQAIGSTQGKETQVSSANNVGPLVRMNNWTNEWREEGWKDWISDWVKFSFEMGVAMFPWGWYFWEAHKNLSNITLQQLVPVWMQ